MQITVTGRHMEITEPIKEYTHGKTENAMAEFPRVESVHVILAVEKFRHLAEIVVQAPNHIKVDARADSTDMYASIDAALEKATRQLRKAWDKMSDHKSREGLAEAELEAEAQSTEEKEG